jgi:hypothetical protein
MACLKIHENICGYKAQLDSEKEEHQIWLDATLMHQKFSIHGESKFYRMSRCRNGGKKLGEIECGKKMGGGRRREKGAFRWEKGQEIQHGNK